MLVQQLMTKEVQTCRPEDTLERAAQRLGARASAANSRQQKRTVCSTISSPLCVPSD
jgi:hypothetical protein